MIRISFLSSWYGSGKARLFSKEMYALLLGRKGEGKGLPLCNFSVAFSSKQSLGQSSIFWGGDPL